MNKNNTGITLIPLVITIIVMLILAGTTIAMLSGNNGMLIMSKEAGDETQIGEDMERIKASYSSITMRKLKAADGRRSYTITAEELQNQILSDLNGSETITAEVTGEDLIVINDEQNDTSVESSSSTALTVKMTHTLKNGKQTVNTYTINSKGDVS